jgi:hypothetical protein
MNFAWHQSRLEVARSAGGGSGGSSGPVAGDPDVRARAASAAAAKAHVLDPAARNCSPHTPCDPDVAQAPAPTDRT